MPLPTGQQRVYSAIEYDGEATLWLVEYAKGQRFKSTRWPFKNGLLIENWTPSVNADALRIAIRLQASGQFSGGEIVVAAVAETENHKNYAAIWSDLHRPSAEIKSAKNICRLSSPPPNDIPFDLRVINIRRKSPIPPETTETLNRLGFCGPLVDLTEAETLRGVRPFHMLAFSKRRYETSSVFSGAPVCSRHTFFVSHPVGRPYVFIRFEDGDKVYYEVYCPFHGRRVAIFDPIRNILVQTLNLEKLIDKFRCLLLAHASLVANYLINTGPKQLAVPVGWMSHWGHVLMHELPGTMRAVEEAGQAVQWLKGPVAYLDHRQLFPETSSDAVRIFNDDEAVFKYSLEENALIIRPQSEFAQLTGECIKRTNDACAKLGQRTGYDDEVRRRIGASSPVVWIEIRSNDRIWLNQVTAIIETAQRLKMRFGNLAVVLAGWSRGPIVRLPDGAEIAREGAIAYLLNAGLPDVPVHSIIGAQIWQKQIWASIIDVYVAGFGTGLSFPHYLAGKPGLTLANAYYLSSEYVDTPSGAGSAVAPSRAPLRVIAGVKTVSSPRGNPEIDNFTCSAAAVADAISEVLKETGR